MRTVGWMIVGWIMVGMITPTPAGAQEQDENYVLDITDASGEPGETADLEVRLTNDGDGISGYSWGVCLDEGLGVDADDVVNGTLIDDTSFLFHAISDFDDGWTVGALLGIGADPIGTGDNMLLYTFTLSLPDDEGEYCAEYCDTLGDPAVLTSVVAGGDEVVPTQEGGCVQVEPDETPFRFAIDDVSVEYDPEDGMATFVVEPTIFEKEGILESYPSDTQGFAMGIAHDASLLEPQSLEPLGLLEDLNEGDGPEFFGVNLEAGGDGVTVGCVYAADDTTVEFEEATAVIAIEYATVADELVGDEVGQTTELTWSNELGSPAVKNMVSVGSRPQPVEFDGATVSLVAVLTPEFVRGDCNGDGRFSITDGLETLNWLFSDGEEGTCNAACDMDDLSGRTLLDAVLFFRFVFTDGADPEPPYPDCGRDDDDDVDCESFEFCEDDA